jgi:uncharacterized protein YndB with AHSA1/START domain
MHNRHYAIHVAATPEMVWHALTDPQMTRKFYFGLAVESSWQPDSAISYRGPGSAVLAGTVVHVEPGRPLVHNLVTGAQTDGPQGWMTWEIEESDPAICRVSLAHDDLERQPDPEQDEVCLRLLSNLKTLLECGAAMIARKPTSAPPEGVERGRP